jgi:dsRNA-specific ribonuclease
MEELSNNNNVGNIMFNPYNPLNIEIKEEDISAILKRYGLPGTINNMNLYKRAFVHRSYTKKTNNENIKNNITLIDCPNNCLKLRTKSNERLEFLGDGILESCTKFIIYRRFTKENEGFMTDKKIELVKNETIGKIAIEMNLNKWLLLSKHAEDKNIRNNISKMGCVFEAFVGSIFLDMEKNGEGVGFTMALTFIDNVFNNHIDWSELLLTNNNYKNILQVKIQKEFKVTPYYLEITHNSEIGYHMGVYLCIGHDHIVAGSTEHINALNHTLFDNIEQIKTHIETNGNILLFLGEGANKMKKKAEQESCYNAIKNLERIKIY